MSRRNPALLVSHACSPPKTSSAHRGHRPSPTIPQREGLPKQRIHFLYDLYTTAPIHGIDASDRPAYRQKSEPPGRHLPVVTTYLKLPQNCNEHVVSNMLLEVHARHKHAPYRMINEIIEAPNEDVARAATGSTTNIVAPCDIQRGKFTVIEVL